MKTSQQTAAAGIAERVSTHRFWLRLFRTCAVAVLLACACGLARAGDCTISLSPVNFGSYDPLVAAPVDANGNVQVDCDATTLGELFSGVSVSIALSPGNSGSYASRSMRQGVVSTLSYNLYTTAGRTTVWGNGTGGTGVQGGVVGGFFSGQPTPRNFTVFGRIPATQDPNVGPHSDTIFVTVTF